MRYKFLILCLLLICTGAMNFSFGQEISFACFSPGVLQKAENMSGPAPIRTDQSNYLNQPPFSVAGNNQASDSLFIGKKYQGGWIFWLDPTGKHGLIAANSDQAPKGIAWNPGPAVATAATENTIYSGQANTKKIISVQGTHSAYAARMCLDLTASENDKIYTDWYLPSRIELNLLYEHKNAVGGLNTTSGIYWSSDESAADPLQQAWEQEFKFGAQLEDDKDQPDQLRCIRKF